MVVQCAQREAIYQVPQVQVVDPTNHTQCTIASLHQVGALGLTPLKPNIKSGVTGQCEVGELGAETKEQCRQPTKQAS